MAEEHPVSDRDDCGNVGSFDINDEVNIAIADRGITGGIEAHFEQDLAESRRLTPERLRRSRHRIVADLSWVLRREQ